MLIYKIGTKVVLRSDIIAAPDFFNDSYVIIGEYCSPGEDEEHYLVYSSDRSDFSWVVDKDIDHKATELINKN